MVGTLKNTNIMWHMLLSLFFLGFTQVNAVPEKDLSNGRERTSINSGWNFKRFESSPDGLTWAELETWVLPSANNFIKDSASHAKRPESDPLAVEYAQVDFDDSDWEMLNLPHDWAIKGPFYQAPNSPGEATTGRLPIFGVGWYCWTITLRPEDKKKSIYLEVDGAMSYSTV